VLLRVGISTPRTELRALSTDFRGRSTWRTIAWMRYISTRGKSEPKGFSEILLEGLASGGVLYVPEPDPKAIERYIAAHV